MPLLPTLAPDKAYFSTSLFLPRSQIAEGPIRRALTFGIVVGEEPRELVIDHPHHLEVPRNYRTLQELRSMGMEVVDLRPTAFDSIDLRPKAGFKMRPHQKPAWANILAGLEVEQDLVLRLATGRGKTVMGWLLACEIGGPTLIVSAQEAHLRTWENELTSLFILKGTIGWIKGKQLEWDRDIVFCTIQTLVKRLESGALPRNFGRRFALAIYDEVHHQGAKWFSRGSDLVVGRRMGLTATLKRIDRCEGVVTAHLGRVVYDDPEEDTLIPSVHVHTTGLVLADNDPALLDKTGQPHTGLMRGHLGRMPSRNEQIVRRILLRLKEGRKVYVLSHSKDQVYELVEMLKTAGLSPGIITGDVKDSQERLRQLNGFDVVVATIGVGKENYNRPEFSALVVGTPMAIDPYAPTEWSQMVGRVQRPHPTKPPPVVDLFMDEGVLRARGMMLGVLRWCHRNDWPVKGDKWTRAIKNLKSNRAFRA